MPKQKADLSTFKASFDRATVLAGKVRAALAALEKEHGPEAWEEERPFLTRAGVASIDSPAIREQFATHVVETTRIGKSNSKRIWFAQTKIAAKVRS